MTHRTTEVPFWLNWLPGSLRQRIQHRPNLLRITSNIGWQFSDRIVRLGVGLVVGVWMARYLGPEQFGLLNFATAFVALFGAIATLGLQGIVVRDIVNDPGQARETLGTAFALRLLGGLAAFLLVLGVISYLRPDDALAKTIVAILGFALVLEASEIVKYWFESQVLSKYTVWVGNGVFVCIAALKIAMLLAEAPLIAFVWAAFAESSIVAVALLLIYSWRGGSLIAWQPTLTRAKSLLRDSWPLIFSSLAIMVYMRIDQIMLGQMINDEAVGIYSAAVRISEVWYFVPMAIVASMFPSILDARRKSDTLYRERFQKLYDLMVLLTLLVAIPMTFFSSLATVLLFGQAYASAGSVLAIHIWAALFVFLGVASSRWFLAENRQILNLQRTLLGAALNIGLNLLLIPKLDALGAAYATVLSYAVVALFFDCIQEETRPMFAMKVRSFNILRAAKNVLGY